MTEGSALLWQARAGASPPPSARRTSAEDIGGAKCILKFGGTVDFREPTDDILPAKQNPRPVGPKGARQPASSPLYA